MEGALFRTGEMVRFFKFRGLELKIQERRGSEGRRADCLRGSFKLEKQGKKGNSFGPWNGDCSRSLYFDLYGGYAGAKPGICRASISRLLRQFSPNGPCIQGTGMEIR